MKSEVEKIRITKEADIKYYANHFFDGTEFAIGFEFENDTLHDQFIVAIGLDLNAFQDKYYYYDKDKNIHISESEKGFLWVSTIGLVAKARITDNKYVNACSSQAVVLTKLLDEAIALCEDDGSYDIDSNSYSMIETLTPALFHNTIFYYEILSKAYLSLNGVSFTRTHRIDTLSSLVRQTMFDKGHNDTLFHAQVITKLEELANHISNIPGKFNEAFVKYDDNPDDTTMIEFHAEHLREVKDFVDLSCDIILDLYYNPNQQSFMKPGLFQRLLNKCQSEEAKKSMCEIYGFLTDKN